MDTGVRRPDVVQSRRPIAITPRWLRPYGLNSPGNPPTLERVPIRPDFAHPTGAGTFGARPDDGRRSVGDYSGAEELLITFGSTIWSQRTGKPAATLAAKPADVCGRAWTSLVRTARDLHERTSADVYGRPADDLIIPWIHDRSLYGSPVLAQGAEAPVHRTLRPRERRSPFSRAESGAPQLRARGGRKPTRTAELTFGPRRL